MLKSLLFSLAMQTHENTGTQRQKRKLPELSKSLPAMLSTGLTRPALPVCDRM